MGFTWSIHCYRKHVPGKIAVLEYCCKMFSIIGTHENAAVTICRNWFPFATVSGCSELTIKANLYWDNIKEATTADLLLKTLAACLPQASHWTGKQIRICQSFSFAYLFQVCDSKSHAAIRPAWQPGIQRSAMPSFILWPISYRFHLV